jgi:hypothetical protein
MQVLVLINHLRWENYEEKKDQTSSSKTVMLMGLSALTVADIGVEMG